MVNAFWLDRDLERAARWLVDSHVLSSVFENAMVLATAVQSNGYEDDDLPFTHPDHPLVVWAEAHPDNWGLLREYVECAHAEWRYRWDHPAEKTHASWAAVESLDEEALADLEWPGDPADPPRLTDGWHADDYVDAYRLYYANEKRHLFEWAKDRTEPAWLAAYTRPAGPAAGERATDSS